jgi:hypothetical protein
VDASRLISVLKRLPAVDDYGFDLPFPEVDFDFERAEEVVMLFLNFFQIGFQERIDAMQVPA